MRATRWIGGMSLVLGMGVIGPTAEASVEMGGNPASGFEVRDVQVTDPAAELERLGARLRYGEGKIGRPVIEVDLSGCRISDETLKLLPPLRQLRVLNLRGTLVSDEGLKTLARIQSLRKLDLRDAHVSLIGNILKLKKAVPNLAIESDDQTGYVPPPAVVP